MRIGFVYQTDAHFNAVFNTALRLKRQYGCEIFFYGLESSYRCNSEKLNILQFNITRGDLKCLESNDYVICCLGGYLLNHVISVLKDTKTSIISLFPGIVSHYQLDAFISRINADQVWLNSEADYKLYATVCKLFDVPNNGIIYGMPWLNLESINISTQENSKRKDSKKAVFFEQTLVLDSSEKRERFIYLLDNLFKSNQDVEFIYKIRDNTNEVFYTDIRTLFSKYNNVTVVDDIDKSDYKEIDFYLTLSSSAIIHGILANKKCYLLDALFLDEDTSQFFYKSNMFLKNLTLNTNITETNSKWIEIKIAKPSFNVNLDNIKKKKKLVSCSRRSNVFIVIYVIIISMFYKAYILNIIKSKYRLKRIQKSLEYLGQGL